MRRIVIPGSFHADHNFTTPRGVEANFFILDGVGVKMIRTARSHDDLVIMRAAQRVAHKHGLGPKELGPCEITFTDDEGSLYYGYMTEVLEGGNPDVTDSVFNTIPYRRDLLDKTEAVFCTSVRDFHWGNLRWNTLDLPVCLRKLLLIDFGPNTADFERSHEVRVEIEVITEELRQWEEPGRSSLLDGTPTKSTEAPRKDTRFGTAFTMRMDGKASHVPDNPTLTIGREVG